MSDETPDNVPVPEFPADEPAPIGPGDEPTQERAGLEPEYLSPGYPPPANTTPANSGWASPPAWGSAPWGQSGWGHTPAAPPSPPSPSYSPYPPADAPTGAGGAGGGGWNYGYGGLWAPPPEVPPTRGPDSTRRVLAVIAVVILVLVSGSIGAVISAAVHDRSSPAIASPFIGGSGNNPFGSNSGTPNTSSNGSSAIASKVNPSLVNIYTTIVTSSGRGQAAGTGMVISSSGEVLTNNHVIADASTVRVELVATGEAHSARVLGYDVKDDVALLQIDNVSNLKAVSVADARKVAVGDSIVAIGNAGGRGSPTVTSGSVTALNQKVTAGDQGTGASETLEGMIEISAPIEPGDSGGPLVNSQGQVIGMNTAAATSDSFSDQGGSTTAFAIPINRAIRLAQQISNREESTNVHVGARGLLGVEVQDINAQLACQVTTNSGALVARTQPGSPADSAGLGQCDVIVSVAGKNVASTSDLNAAMFPYHPDDKVTVGWVDPSGSSHQADLTLITGPPA